MGRLMRGAQKLGGWRCAIRPSRKQRPTVWTNLKRQTRKADPASPRSRTRTYGPCTTPITPIPGPRALSPANGNAVGHTAQGELARPEHLPLQPPASSLRPPPQPPLRLSNNQRPPVGGIGRSSTSCWWFSHFFSNSLRCAACTSTASGTLAGRPIASRIWRSYRIGSSRAGGAEASVPVTCPALAAAQVLTGSYARACRWARDVLLSLGHRSKSGIGLGIRTEIRVRVWIRTRTRTRTRILPALRSPGRFEGSNSDWPAPAPWLAGWLLLAAADHTHTAELTLTLVRSLALSPRRTLRWGL
ncbi:hypothetical protein PYCCODRAFT_1152867 [Trametes coccinea BRFM310]|uniref:Uncharacterized protein n=1 Tax=Trametes coccinea (strain BRFM310) TaxID=1353009 RepID=A0A1Y2IWT8_TRAC3|nr:hypothetical protein PYCCODRAFT_1152867 [Trametes coccinea BRFM310]